jgi:hypothetical protein
MDTHSRYGTALTLLLVAYVVDAFEGPWVQLLVGITYVLILSLLILDPKASPWAKMLGLTLVGVSIAALAIFSAMDSPPESLSIASLFLSALVIGAAVAMVLRRIAGHQRVDLSTVLGAVLAYALLGFLFSSLYRAVDLMTTTAFFAQGDVLDSDYLYFSFVTLTTLGYGDLSPAIEIGKRLIVLEALLGEVFLVVLVARMVSLWKKAESPLSTAEEDSEDASST